MGTYPATDLFRPVESGTVPWSRWAISMASHFVILGIVVAVPGSVAKRGLQSHLSSAPLAVSLFVPSRTPAPMPPKRLPAPPASPLRRMPESVKEASLQKESFKPYARPLRAATTDSIHLALPSIDLSQIDAPAVSQPLPSQPTIELSLPAVDPTVTRPAAKVVVGGFGNPAGARPSATSAGKHIAPRTGSFDLPAGPGRGGGGATTIARSGFDDGYATPTRNSAPARGEEAQSSSFADYRISPSAPRRQAASVPMETAVEITYKPKPLYTAEAREKHIEGEVLLEVAFLAAGQVEVLRVVRGLGFGLDENAADAARNIRFTPATKEGTPVDSKGAVHIIFKLS